MNIHKKVLLGSLLLVSASNVFAIDTAGLYVVGTIVPAACTPTFAGGGVVDYDVIPTGSLGAATPTELPAKNITYSIRCDAPIVIGTSWGDERGGSAIPGHPYGPYYAFGLGQQGTANIGRYSIQHDSTASTGDGAPVDLVYAATTAGPWAPAPADFADVRVGGRIHAYAATGTVVPGAYTDFGGTLRVVATIAPTDDLDLSSAVTLDGLSTMTVRYL